MFNIPVAPVNDTRRPFVHFEEKEYGINQTASVAAGRPVPRVELFAIIHPVGSKDSIEKVATEWLTDIRAKAVRGLYNPDWVDSFERDYQEYLRGNELPREGTPVKTWQMITREQGSRLRAVGITTVEDLAALPDSGLGVVGLDGRVLRDKARVWISEAQDKGVIAQELANANEKIRQLEERTISLENQLQAKTAKEKA